ncbi:hypothetical protein SDC9_115088 [bioreactor metagenome]|uniref:Uncharacterized protein n=1 Tax=bioreactor metagenome TaxID=1076179 RepID=A0A645BSE6_9ZZZZ
MVIDIGLICGAEDFGLNLAGVLRRHIFNRLLGQTAADPGRVLAVMRRVHVSIGGNRQHDIHHYRETAAPGAEQSAHFLFVRGGRRRAVTLGARP